MSKVLHSIVPKGVLAPTRWPSRPYCTNAPSGGVLVRNFNQAMHYPLIQPNPPGVVIRMTFDLDKPGCSEPAFAYDTAGLPPPNWIAINRENGHAHSSYELEYPVRKENTKGMKFLSSLERAYGAALGADRSYHGNLVKNPFSKQWDVLYLRKEPYTLVELADWIPDTKKALQKPVSMEECFSIGRNAAVFDVARKKAYKAVRDFWELGDFSGFLACVYRIVGESWIHVRENHDWSSKNHEYRKREMDATATSIARWVWLRFTPDTFRVWSANSGFSSRQSIRGTLSGKKRLDNAKQKWAEARKMLDSGKSVSETARILNVSPSTVFRWKSRFEKDTGSAVDSSKETTRLESTSELSSIEEKNVEPETKTINLGSVCRAESVLPYRNFDEKNQVKTKRPLLIQRSQKTHKKKHDVTKQKIPEDRNFSVLSFRVKIF